MIIKEAQVQDIPELQLIRNSVKENVLSNPALIKDEDYTKYLVYDGKGWLSEIEKTIAGFSIVDTKQNNVWALFVHPEYEGMGIGKQLLKTLLNWYFENTTTAIWLTTACNTRAEEFYKRQGWKDAGFHGTKERKFIMIYEDWIKLTK